MNPETNKLVLEYWIATQQYQLDLQQFVIAAEEYRLNTEEERNYVGSIPGHKVVHRDRVAGNYRLYKDYFAAEPVFDETFFRRRFRMRRSLFMKILNEMKVYDPKFRTRKNACNQSGFSPIQIR